MSESRKLTVYFGERDRVGGAFLADRILDVFAHHRLGASVLLRGAEGFGIKHLRRTDRLLTLSEDLPLVALGVDSPDRIAAALEEVRSLRFDGLVTVERARTAANGLADGLEGIGEEVKLTLYLGRGATLARRPAYEVALEVLHDVGVAGGTVLVGVDGTIDGERERARFFSRNDQTPLMVISVGSRESIREAAATMSGLDLRHAITLERVTVLKRDGRRIGELPVVEPDDGRGLARWTKLMLYSAEQNHFEGRPVHVAAVERLRREGARGATAIRGIRGYHGDHLPHGDTLWSIRRRVPTLTIAVDRPDQAVRWLQALDDVTPETGLITSEVVPAYEARAGDRIHGGLRLAEPWR
jgi:PII-like signaling protein